MGLTELRGSRVILHLVLGYVYKSEQLPVDLIAQMGEHCTGMAEVTDSNPVQA